MTQACELFGISRQAHYQKRQREIERKQEEEQVLAIVRQVKHKHPNMGGRKVLSIMQPRLAAEGLQMGRDRLFELLRRQDLLVQRRKTYRRTDRSGLVACPQPTTRTDHRSSQSSLGV